MSLVAAVATAICGIATAGLSDTAFAQERSDSIRVVQRTRYETLNGQYRPGLSGSDQALALQTSLLMEGRLGAARFLGELMDSRTELSDEGSFVNTTTVNALEPVQAYVSWTSNALRKRIGANDLKLGRFTMDVGRRRLVARSSFRNTVSSFAGVDWGLQWESGRAVRIFHVIPMRILPAGRADLLDNDQELDRGNRDTTFSGALHQWPAFRTGDRLELAWYGVEQGAHVGNDSPPRDLDTVGLRVFRPAAPGRWSYEVEAVVQTGRSRSSLAPAAPLDLDHRAHFYHWEIGYSFEREAAPTLSLQYDYSTGDEDPFDARSEAFDTLYGERRFDYAPQGIYGAFARSNLETPGVRLTFRPKPRWQAMLSYRSFRLASARDVWAGVGLRDVTGRAGRSLGTQLEGSFVWAAIRDRLSVETGFAQLSAGRFIRETSQPFRGNPTYFYTVVTTTF